MNSSVLLAKLFEQWGVCAVSGMHGLLSLAVPPCLLNTGWDELVYGSPVDPLESEPGSSPFDRTAPIRSGERRARSPDQLCIATQSAETHPTLTPTALP